MQRLRAHNIALLEQGAALLASIDDAAFTATHPLLQGGTIGAHLRHCLEFYTCLLDASGIIDHRARRRDAEVEQSRTRALGVLRDVIARLRTIQHDAVVEVRLDLPDDEAAFARSTLRRELEAAANHTIHHFAVIALLLRARGIAPPRDFGVAPSTLDYRRRACPAS